MQKLILFRVFSLLLRLLLLMTKFLDKLFLIENPGSLKPDEFLKATDGDLDVVITFLVVATAKRVIREVSGLPLVAC